jgi:hypothetical protein
MIIVSYRRNLPAPRNERSQRKHLLSSSGMFPSCILRLVAAVTAEIVAARNPLRRSRVKFHKI